MDLRTELIADALKAEHQLQMQYHIDPDSGELR